MRVDEVLRKDLLGSDSLTAEELLVLMKCTDENELQKIYDAAYAVKKKYVDAVSYYRGLIEFSNICKKNCNYCGIRKDNDKAERFMMDRDDIMEMAAWAYENGYGSVTLQSGERSDEPFIEYVEGLLRDIKSLSNGELGVTLCVGEQEESVYHRFKKAGADRYLLRIESTNRELYEQIHPKDENHSFDTRVRCIGYLKNAGLQVGTGVMIGLPNQTEEDLVNDILFFKKNDIDMIGMGPYVVHHDTPLGQYAIEHNLDTPEEHKRRVRLGIAMVALTRLYLKDVNIAATTALQALDPLGREKALRAGANILMPVLTVAQHRAKYLLYDNKPTLKDEPEEAKDSLAKRVEAIGDRVGWFTQGNSHHFYNRKENKE